MSSKDAVVVATDLSKSYNIVHEAKMTTLGESIIRKIKKPFSKPTKETFWALKDVNFEIERGDVVGIIGRNGAGKSTLLKVLSRITAPTTGEIRIKGRVGSLLEVGTGFHPELTGRENLYLNGAILGMKKKEIDARFDEIVDFSGVEQFLDTPVKRYSSGMYVRLAFSVAAHLDPEVMIVDEVLAVGDSEFQKKCLGKMQDVARSGRTVLFVSHNMQTVSQLCSTCIMLKSGSVEFYGPGHEAISRYIVSQEQAALEPNPTKRPGSGEYRITDVKLAKTLYDSGEPINVQLTVENHHDQMPIMHLQVQVFDEANQMVVQCDSQLQKFTIEHKQKQDVQFQLSQVNLKPGRYRVDTFLHFHGFIDQFEGSAHFDVSPILPGHLAKADLGYQHGQVIGMTEWWQD